MILCHCLSGDARSLFRDSVANGLGVVTALSRDDGRRFVVHADEKLTAFLELEGVTRESLRFLNLQ
jgi:hypothetical protein